MTTDTSESKLEKYFMVGIAVFCALVFAGLCLYYAFRFTNFFPYAPPIDEASISKLRGDFGVMGDFFGGILNPILAFSTVLLLVISLRVQIKELRATTREIAAATEAHKDQVEIAQLQLEESRANLQVAQEQLRLSKEREKNARDELEASQLQKSTEAKKLAKIESSSELIGTLDGYFNHLEKLYSRPIRPSGRQDGLQSLQSCRPQDKMGFYKLIFTESDYEGLRSSYSELPIIFINMTDCLTKIHQLGIVSHHTVQYYYTQLDVMCYQELVYFKMYSDENTLRILNEKKGKIASILVDSYTSEILNINSGSQVT
ncbi:hypothetical protein PRUB_a4071 [Pseudoalteromonas rubra]|uniref:Uncharacterized protein n=1 Tax=Pseudoalteromonas rubra TaxID=43658 RepID=A0A8T0C951_9GAMM|nr:hypothetical protein [Pseudoalteromonas rubra]KAF7787193.1 hypothetical protein PRUB_a4071 [Pseudoalteromonas rubra]